MTKKINNRTKRRGIRGVTTVIGGLFAIIVMAAALNIGLWSVREHDSIGQKIFEKQNADLNSLKEDIRLDDIRITNNKLDLAVTNDGSSRAVLKSLYIVNETSHQQYRYDLDIPVNGRETVKNIGQSAPAAVLRDDAAYTVKVVSESGESVTARIKTVSEFAFPMSLFVVPSTVTTLENVTLLFSVTNNLTDGDVLASEVTPILSKSLGCGTGGENCEFSERVTPEPAIIPAGNTALFKWVFQVSAPAGTTMTFNASLANGMKGNYVVETGQVEIVQEAVRANEVILGPSLLQRPDVFVIAPGPFGEPATATSKGYWGVVMANPVNITMHVKKVAINVYASTTDAATQILTTGCGVVGISPQDTNWSCPHNGVLTWTNLQQPMTIPPYSAYTFLAKAKGGQLPAGQPQSAFIISIYVFTDFGQFTRQGYATNMFYDKAAVVNMYLTDTSNPSQAMNTNRIFGNRILQAENQVSGANNSTHTIYVSVADFDDDVTTYVNSGATLIINIPVGLGYIDGLGNQTISLPVPNGFSSATATPYPDGSVQIRAVTNSITGNKNPGEAKVFSFDIDVPPTNSTKTYAMHTFLEGAVNTSPAFPADGFGTFAILVCPESECA